MSECIEDRSILWTHFDKISVWKHCVASGGEESRETQEGIDAVILAQHETSLNFSGGRERQVWCTNSANMAKLNFTDITDELVHK